MGHLIICCWVIRKKCWRHAGNCYQWGGKNSIYSVVYLSHWLEEKCFWDKSLCRVLLLVVVQQQIRLSGCLITWNASQFAALRTRQAQMNYRNRILYVITFILSVHQNTGWLFIIPSGRKEWTKWFTRTTMRSLWEICSSVWTNRKWERFGNPSKRKEQALKKE